MRVPRICGYCGTDFVATGGRQFFCCLECRVRSMIMRRGPDDCWFWSGPKRREGHATIGIWDGCSVKHEGVSRLLWKWEHGDIAPGLCVCHRCDNPPCCNLAHFFLGTRAENIADMVAKARHSRGAERSAFIRRMNDAGLVAHARGARCSHKKLTEDDVRAIRSSYAAGGVSHAALAKEFGVHRSVIGNVVRLATWAHVA